MLHMPGLSFTQVPFNMTKVARMANPRYNAKFVLKVFFKR